MCRPSRESPMRFRTSKIVLGAALDPTGGRGSCRAASVPLWNEHRPRGSARPPREGERPREPPLCDQPPSTDHWAALGIQPNGVVVMKSMSWTPETHVWITANPAAVSEETWVECCPEYGVVRLKAQRRLSRSFALPSRGLAALDVVECDYGIGSGTWVECCPENGVVRLKAQRRLSRSFALPSRGFAAPDVVECDFGNGSGTWVECCPENVVVRLKAQRRLSRSFALPSRGFLFPAPYVVRFFRHS